MKNEFITQLQADEELLFYGVANITKTSKQYGRYLFTLLLLASVWWILIITLNEESLLNILKLAIILLVVAIITIALIYGLLYNTFFKYRNKKNEYFVTNKRIALYNPKRGFRIENIADIEHIGIAREKNNYGDLAFSFYESDLIKLLKNTMNFEGIENPRYIVKLICSINTNIHVYDDRATIMGEKI